MKNDCKTSVQVVLCTVPSGSAHTIASELITCKLAACINILPVRSVYKWEGSICDETEDLLIIKTTEKFTPKLISTLVVIHPYDTPEVICLPVTDGYHGYLSWIIGEMPDNENVK